MTEQAGLLANRLEIQGRDESPGPFLCVLNWTDLRRAEGPRFQVANYLQPAPELTATLPRHKYKRFGKGTDMGIAFYLILFIATCTFGWFSRGNKSG